MNAIFEAFAGLFSLTGLLAFIAGVAATRVYYWFKERYMDRNDPKGQPHHVGFRGLTMLWALIFITTGFIGFQQQQTATQVRSNAADTKECQREFNTALLARSAISEDNDHWSAIQRKALGDWLHEILLPPAEIQHIRDTDPNFGTNPVYVQWGWDVTQYYYGIIEKAQLEQEQNQRERAAHPLPEPTCGR